MPRLYLVVAYTHQQNAERRCGLFCESSRAPQNPKTRSLFGCAFSRFSTHARLFRRSVVRRGATLEEKCINRNEGKYGWNSSLCCVIYPELPAWTLRHWAGFRLHQYTLDWWYPGWHWPLPVHYVSKLEHYPIERHKWRYSYETLLFKRCIGAMEGLATRITKRCKENIFQTLRFSRTERSSQRSTCRNC